MKLLTVKEVAEIIKAKPSTIYSWAEQGVIPCLKINGLLRFDEDKIISWLRDSCKKQIECYNYRTSDRRPRKGGE
jgi:excisionase family DNA binding protein